MNVELLAPAGGFSKLKTAFYFGADAAYIGGKEFSLRSFADNFTRDEMTKAVEFAHSQNKKIYVTTNIVAKNEDLKKLEDYFVFLEECKADGAIISDIGAFTAAKKKAPKLNLHISTQANVTNKYSVKFWKDSGASRVILARELSLPEIREIKDYNPDVELEAFVHGAMCISYSGRCLLSDYLSGRPSNRGECVQACRWQYEIRKHDSISDSGWLGFEEDERGTFILNSKDLNMARYLSELEAAGVCSFKIEGRMKSEYYLATVINAYRRCIDGGYDSVIERELNTATHRDYTTAYAFGKNDKTVNYTDSQAKGDCDYIGNVLSYSDGFATVEMRTRFYTGDKLEILSPSRNFGKEFEVTKAFLPSGESVTDCKRVQENYRINCPYEVSAGDILRRRK